jgi:hypothetical protein
MNKPELVQKYEHDQEEWQKVWDDPLVSIGKNAVKNNHLETEPIFGIHITFCDGSKPIEYFNLNLKQTAVVLQEWSDEWILIPDKDCKLNGTVWNWHANVRHTEKPKAKESEPKTEEPVEPYFREIEED